MCKANSEINANFPKCINCLQNNCYAGKVNHDSRNTELERAQCLFDCDCKQFLVCENYQELKELMQRHTSVK